MFFYPQAKDKNRPELKAHFVVTLMPFEQFLNV